MTCSGATKLNLCASCRRNRDATRKDLRHAAALLVAAAGIKLPAALNVTTEADRASGAFSPQYPSGLHFSDKASLPALTELARAYEAGTLHPRLAGAHGQHICFQQKIQACLHHKATEVCT